MTPLDQIRAAFAAFKADKDLEWRLFVDLVAVNPAAASHLLTFMNAVKAAIEATP